MARGLLEAIPLRPELLGVWLWYLDLSSARQFVGGMSVRPQCLSYSDIHAWCVLHGITLEPWQIRSIRLLDACHMRALMMDGEQVLEELCEDGGS